MSDLLPMKAGNIAPLIERNYREGGAFQWVREVTKNSLEAGATKIVFSVDWQGVEEKNRYYRVIADNGKGMDPEELPAFFRTYGGGGKAIGAEDENFGVGAKTSLLPWNKRGVIVLSRNEGVDAAIWIAFDETSGKYGLRQFDVGDGVSPVFVPGFDEELGIDLSAIWPKEFDEGFESGTCLLLLGNTPSDDTIDNDPNRAADEAGTKALTKYLNERFWNFDGVEVRVHEFRNAERKDWPGNHSEGNDVSSTKRINRRRISGASFFVAPSKGKLLSDTVTLDDGTQIDWYYLPDGRDSDKHQIFGFDKGFRAVFLDGELYNRTKHANSLKTFGIVGRIKPNVSLIIRPPVYSPNESWGVYSKTDRNSLVIRGGKRAGDELPFNEWGREFTRKMPDVLRKALNASFGSSQIERNEWTEKLAERYAKRWTMFRNFLTKDGEISTDPIFPKKEKPTRERRGIKKTDRKNPFQGGEFEGANVAGANDNGAESAKRRSTTGGIPFARWVSASEMPTDTPVILASFVAHDPEHPEGVICLNQDHPAIVEQVESWRERYPHIDVDAEGSDPIQKAIHDVYKAVMVCKVAHARGMKSEILTENVIETQLLSDWALTTAALGLMAEDHIIATRLGGILGKAA